ncbi:MAG: hypothetical protein ACM3UW_05105 [Bacillota bacterium]
MSLKITELQVMLPKTSEISRTQQIQMQENFQRQQELATQFANQTERAETTVNQTPPGKEALIRDKQERGKKRENGRQKAGNSSGKENRKDIPKSDSIIDILV